MSIIGNQPGSPTLLGGNSSACLFALSSGTTNSAGGQLLSFSVYFGTLTSVNSVVLGLYTNSGNQPGTLIANTSVVGTTSNVLGWKTYTVSGGANLPGNTTFWIVASFAGTGLTEQLAQDATIGFGSYYTSPYSYTGSLPANFGTPTGSFAGQAYDAIATYSALPAQTLAFVSSSASGPVFTFTAFTGMTGGITYYMHRSTTPCFTPSGTTPGTGTCISAGISPGVNYTDSAITAGTSYYYCVQGIDSVSATANTNYAIGTIWDTPLVFGGVGDSIMYGLLSSTTPLNEMATRLGCFHRERSITVFNKGVAGSDTASWQPGQSYYTSAVAIFNSSAITDMIIMLGTNDANLDSLAPATYGTNMAAIISGMKSAVATIQRVWICYPPWRTQYTTNPNSNLLMAQYQPILDAMDNGTNTFVIGKEAWNHFGEIQTDLNADGTHPTTNGDYALGSIWARDIHSHLYLDPITQASDAATLTGTTLNAAGGNTSVTFGAATGIANSAAVFNAGEVYCAAADYAIVNLHAAQILGSIVMASGTVTGTYLPPVSTDPGIANVLSGVTYEINNINKTGTYASSGGSGTSTSVSYAIAKTDIVQGSTPKEIIGPFWTSAGVPITSGTPLAANFQLNTGGTITTPAGTFTSLTADAKCTYTFTAAETATLGQISLSGVVGASLEWSGLFEVGTISGRALGGAVGPLAGINNADIPVNATPMQSGPLVATVYTASGAYALIETTSSITYTIYDLEQTGPECITGWTPATVAGHSGVSLSPSSVMFDTLQTSALGTNYNFVHTPSESLGEPYPHAGVFLIAYTFTPTFGSVFYVNFRVSARW